MENLKGTIFDVRRFATHDGGGIRTTVFSRAVNCSVHGVTIQREFRQNVERCISIKNAFIAEAASKIQNAAE